MIASCNAVHPGRLMWLILMSACTSRPAISAWPRSAARIRPVPLKESLESTSARCFSAISSRSRYPPLVEIRYALWTVLSLALTSAPSAISARARRRSLCQAALINCSFSRACCFGPSLAGGLSVGWAAGRLVTVGLLKVADRLGCCDGPDAAGVSALQAVTAKTAAARTADMRMGLIDQPPRSTVRPSSLIGNHTHTARLVAEREE